VAMPRPRGWRGAMKTEMNLAFCALHAKARRSRLTTACAPDGIGGGTVIRGVLQALEFGFVAARIQRR
jgi:hypothetical protein